MTVGRYEKTLWTLFWRINKCLYVWPWSNSKQLQLTNKVESMHDILESYNSPNILFRFLVCCQTSLWRPTPWSTCASSTPASSSPRAGGLSSSTTTCGSLSPDAFFALLSCSSWTGRPLLPPTSLSPYSATPLWGTSLTPTGARPHSLRVFWTHSKEFTTSPNWKLISRITDLRWILIHLH